jgi:hypothetical protein
LSQLSEQGKTVKLSHVALLITIIAEFRPLIGPAIPEIVKLLRHTSWEVCRTGVDALSQLSEHGKMDNVSDVAFLMTIIAEFRPLIGPAIPEIIKLLKPTSWDVCRAGIDALLQLSEHGKIENVSDVAFLMTIIAEFRPLIGPVIPEIVKLLENTNWTVCLAGVDALSQLSEHGKMDNVSDVAFLMTIIAEFRPLITTAIVNLLKDSDKAVRQAGVDALSQLSGQGRTVKLSNIALLMTIIAKFRPSIAPAIPEIANLLKHSDRFVRQAGVDAVSQLSKHGKTVNLSRLAFLMYTIAEFRPLIGTVISELLDSFNANDKTYLQSGMYVGPIFSKR